MCREAGRQPAGCVAGKEWIGDKTELSEAVQWGLRAGSTCVGKLPGF